MHDAWSTIPPCLSCFGFSPRCRHVPDLWPSRPCMHIRYIAVVHHHLWQDPWNTVRHEPRAVCKLHEPCYLTGILKQGCDAQGLVVISKSEQCPHSARGRAKPGLSHRTRANGIGGSIVLYTRWPKKWKLGIRQRWLGPRRLSRRCGAGVRVRSRNAGAGQELGPLWVSIRWHVSS